MSFKFRYRFHYFDGQLELSLIPLNIILKFSKIFLILRNKRGCYVVLDLRKRTIFRDNKTFRWFSKYIFYKHYWQNVHTTEILLYRLLIYTVIIIFYVCFCCRSYPFWLSRLLFSKLVSMEIQGCIEIIQQYLYLLYIEWTRESLFLYLSLYPQYSTVV